MSNDSTATLPLAVRPLSIAHRFLNLSLHHDYLSTGQGHRNSRRVVAERQAAVRRPPLPPAGSVTSCGDPESSYLNEVARRARLTSREEYGLAVRMRAGDVAAHDALVEAHLGLVVMFARRYQRPGVPVLDLVAEGNFGLLSAAQRFDPERGHRFATYAKWWVMRAILVALPKLTSVVRIPVGRSAARATEPAEAAEATASGAAPPAPDDDLAAAREGASDTPLQEPEVEGAQTALPGRPDVAERSTAGPGRGLSDEDVLNELAMPSEHEPQEELMALQRKALLHRVLQALPARDRVIVSRRYALICDEVCTLDELAREFSVSIERVRQIEKAALGKLQLALCEAGESAQTLL